MNLENGKKLLCCVAMLLQFARGNGNAKGVPKLREKTQKIVDYVKQFDSEVLDVPDLNGKAGIIGACEALVDAIGRGLVVPECDIPQKLVDKWAEAADQVLH